MAPFDFEPRTRVVFGPGTVARLGELARALGFRHTLLVADPGLVAAGHVEQAARILTAVGVELAPFHAFDANPDTAMVEAGAAFARGERIDSLVGLGGGSSLDCTKGINFVLTNGGGMADYQGYGKAYTPLLPMIAVPTTAGTGSEAQSYALISYNCTHDPERPQGSASSPPERDCRAPSPRQSRAARPRFARASLPRGRNSMTGASEDAEFRLDAPLRNAHQAAFKIKMACGDPSAASRIAVLDPELTLSQPAAVTATAGYDALSHAVEAFVTARRNDLSDLFSREAFRLLEAHYKRLLRDPRDLEA